MLYDHHRILKLNETLNDRAGKKITSSQHVSFQPRLTAVLVPLDGTPVAEHALPTAIALARRAGAKLRLVYVHDLMDCVSDPIQLLSLTYRATELVRERVDYLSQLVQRIERSHSISVRATLVRSERMEAKLCEITQSTDLVVMAVRPRNWWTNVTGNVVNRLAPQLVCPLLVVPGYQSPVDLTGEPLPTEVVVPLDGSAVAEQMVATASAMAQLYRARLTLLHVRSLRPAFPPKTPMRYMEQIAMPLRTLHPVRTLVLESNGRTVAQSILSYLKVREGGLLTITSPRGTSWKQFWRPGTTHALMAKYQGPLLLQSPVNAPRPAAVRTLQTC